uniref:Uncharacterized protein n=1 Tax=Rhizophora mucronata TaxID=61149 RepID=A0A2P2Q7A1_RHIMU
MWSLNLVSEDILGSWLVCKLEQSAKTVSGC